MTDPQADPTRYFALGEEALAAAENTMDAREAEAFIDRAVAYFTGGILAWVLTGQADGVDLAGEDLPARHPFATIALLKSVKKHRSPAADTTGDQNTTTANTMQEP